MTQEEFIEAVRSEVKGSAVDGLCAQLVKPSGRKPPEKIKALSDWYNSLDSEAQGKVREVVELASHHAVFGFLAVLDGVRPIEDDVEKGDLRLFYEKAGAQVLLNDPSAEMLHDIFNA